MVPEPPKPFNLPELVVGPADIGRLIRELGSIDESLLGLSLRTPGHDVKMPKTSWLIDRTAELNKLNLLHENDRKQLRTALETIKREAPLLHISFSTDPSSDFIEKLMAWLRREIHPVLLVTIGLQPNIGAGCVIRGTNHYFDFSLRQDFANKREMLIASLVPQSLKEIKA
jgi:hypothetical protein